ncbi:MAG: metal ABC transporter permease [Ilumatobacteraceae bacterium]|nr:metal ABC transporter permease [Ilumatobacteraceae bacterium]
MGFLIDPWNWWIEPFSGNEFMRDALVAGLLTVITTSLVGTWVVLRGMSFLGDALAHGVLPGIAIAFIIGVDTSIGAFVAAAAMIGGITLIRRHSPLPDDTSIGVLFVGFLALAVVIMSTQRASYTGDLNRFLFGSITGLDSGDITRQAIAAAIALIGVIVLYRALLVMTFDESLARMLGLRPGLTQGALLMLLAVSIVASFESVGNLLVFAFLIAPPAAASLVVKRVPMIMVVSIVFGSAATVVGILISYHHRSAAGASMALCSVVLFFIVLAATVVRKSLAGRRMAIA